MFILIPEKNIKLSEEFNDRVMARVRFVYYLKKVINPTFIESCIFISLAIAGTTFVSLRSIIYNAPTVTDIGKTFLFWINAYLNTEIQFQIIIIAMIIIGELLVFGTFKNILNIESRAQGLYKMVRILGIKVKTS